MSDTPKTPNPPAFPSLFRQKGMSLLDVFALNAPPVPEWFAADQARKEEQGLDYHGKHAKQWPYYWAKLQLEERTKHIQP